MGMKWFQNAKFRKKFIFAFGVLMSFFVVLSLFEIFTIHQIETSFFRLTEGPNKRLVYAADAVAELAYCRRYILTMGYETDDIEYINSCYENYLTSSERIIGYLDAYYENFISDESLSDFDKESRRTIISGVKDKFLGEYSDNVEQLYEAAARFDREAVREIVANGLPIGTEMTQSLRELREMVQLHVEEITESTQKSVRNAISVVIIFASALLVVSLALSVFMASALRGPIVKMESAMSEIVKGNFSYPIRSGRKDELGILSNHIGDMVDNIAMLNKAVAIVDNVAEMIIVTDLDFNLIFVNRMAEELFEINKDEVVGKKCYCILHHLEEPCCYCPMPELLAQKETFPSQDWEHQFHLGGEDIWFACKTTIIRWVDGSLVQIFTCIDESLRKQHEEQQKRHAEELREAALAAESASRAKSTFLANMSHEIRTPMNAVMGMSELILRKELPPDIYENAQAIKTASQNLLSIINDILDLSKIESGMLEIVETGYHFTSLMNDVISIIRIRLAEKPILLTVRVDARIPAHLIGDEIRARQILLNLLGNAVKYTAKGLISLTVSGEVKDGEVVLTAKITDSGIGIREEDIASLFEDFVQIDTKKNKGIEGTGLGLPISLRLCKAMGGDIMVESEYGKGSTFTVILPQKFEEYKPYAAVEGAAELAVLLYEPRAEYRDSIAAALEDLGVRCEIAGDTSSLFGNLERYSHVFIPSLVYEGMEKALRKLTKPPKAVVLAEITEQLKFGGVTVLTLPAHSLPIANVLNNVSEERDNASSLVDVFHAPEASVLIVDDMSSNLMVAKGLMAPFEMKVALCSSGEEALRLVEENRYDLIFMDHMMPGMDGLETTRRIRLMEGAYFAEVPIIALTANAISGARAMFIQNGMNDFLAKPIETAKLNAILEKWIPSEKRKRIPTPERRENQSAADSAFLSSLLTVPDLRVEQAVSMMGGSADVYEDVFKLSIRILPEKAAALEEYLPGDMTNYSIAVHGIKGVLNNIGAYELGKEAYELEKLSLLKDAESCQGLHPGFIRRLDEFIRVSAEVVEQHANTSKTKGDAEALKGILPSLEEALEFYSATQALELLAEWEGFTFGEEIDGALAELRRAFEDFDFEAATLLCEKFREVLKSNG